MRNVWGAMAYVEHQVEIAIEAEPENIPNELHEAQRLAHRVSEYWASRGTPVQTWVEREIIKIAGHRPRAVFSVRSSLNGGRPQARQMRPEDLGL